MFIVKIIKPKNNYNCVFPGHWSINKSIKKITEKVKFMSRKNKAMETY